MSKFSRLKKHILYAAISAAAAAAVTVSAFAAYPPMFPPAGTNEAPTEPGTSDTSEPVTSDSSDTSEPVTSEPVTSDTSEPPTSDTSEPDTSEPVTSEPLPPEPEVVLGFTQTTLEINTGVKLTASVINADVPNPVVGFQSSNTAVAIVDNAGNIFAVGEGTAYITAYWGDYASSAIVTVYKPAAVPEFLVLTKSSFELKIGATAQIEAKLLPDDVAAGYSIKFVSDAPDIASVSENGLITAKSAGTAVITVSGANLTKTVTVKVSTDIAYDHVKLDGYLYNNEGSPMAGTQVLIDGLIAVTDTRGYFFFEQVEKRGLTLRISGDDKAVCSVEPQGDTTVYLLYAKGKPLTRLSSYGELAGQLPISKVTFVGGANIVLTEGETFELQYQYTPKDANVTEILYTCSNEITALVGQIDGIITAKAPGEADVTVSLNGGQAETVCHIVVNPKESTAYSVLIAVTESLVMGGLAAACVLVYRRYRKKLSRSLDKYDEE